MSRHHAAQDWGNKSKKFRALLASMLPAQCYMCGDTVTSGDKWDVGHIVPASRGGKPELSNLLPVHASCNRRDGGKESAQRNKARARRRDTAKQMRASTRRRMREARAAITEQTRAAKGLRTW